MATTIQISISILTSETNISVNIGPVFSYQTIDLDCPESTIHYSQILINSIPAYVKGINNQKIVKNS